MSRRNNILLVLSQIVIGGVITVIGSLFYLLVLEKFFMAGGHW